ncbi:hypothetical protein P879_07791 [Paragonimus westermani]|uniref:Uncharacterized protein n=1 Tax=Paragonimus westermani TaxID=34504 RepID=A0A8T0DFA0_9TREM|nr:hypothetical protein P879_07791 [Paragonimus westermani]
MSSRDSEWRWSFHDSQTKLSPEYSAVSQSCPPLTSLSASFNQSATLQEASVDGSKNIYGTNCQSPISGRSMSHFDVQQTENPLHSNCVGGVKHTDSAVLPTMPVVTQSNQYNRSFPEALCRNLTSDRPRDWDAGISPKHSAPPESSTNHMQTSSQVISSAHSLRKSRESVGAGSPSSALNSPNLPPSLLDQNGSANEAGVSCLDCPSGTHFSQLRSFRELLTAVLDEQRRSCCRPESLSLMTADQIQQEKIDLQKGLLYFERLYGRPKDAVSRRTMKPLYERYRLVKRLLRRLPRVLESTKYVRNAVEIENIHAEDSDRPPDSTAQIMLNASTCASRISLVSKPHSFGTRISPDSPKIVDVLAVPVNQYHDSSVGSNHSVSHTSMSSYGKSPTSSVYALQRPNPRSDSQSLRNTHTEIRPEFEWKRNHTDPNPYTLNPVQLERVSRERSQLLARKRALQRELRAFENNVRITTGICLISTSDLLIYHSFKP